MSVTIERAEVNEKTFREIMDGCLVGLREYAIAPINQQKVLDQAYLTLKDGMTFIARDELGAVVGCIGMMETDFWYSDDTFLLNRIGPYIRPDQRFGVVGVRLMKAVRALADERNQLAFVWVMKPGRVRKAASMLYAQVAGYVPVGHVVAMMPKPSRAQ